MSGPSYLAIYSFAILLFSMAGGYVPFIGGKVPHGRLQLYLSLSAGFMLGASFFHVMPEAMKLSGETSFGWWMSVGVVGLFCIERFIAPHSHEVNGGTNHNHKHNEKEGHYHEPEPHMREKEHMEHRAAAPAVAGWMAVLGLTIHTFMNGVGLAGSVLAGLELQPGSALPGMAMFLAIFLHKPADALAISTVLSRKGVSRDRIAIVQLLFGCMVPLGAIAFWLAQRSVEEVLRNQITGAALAFSSGTFLFIALSDLLPEVQFHRHDRVPLFLSLVCGVAFMGGIALLEGHEDGDHEHGGHHLVPAHSQGNHDRRDNEKDAGHRHGEKPEHDEHDRH
jgi:zinc and cadmium transporter